MTHVAQSGLVFLGLDVSKNAISVGVLPVESDAVAVDRIFTDEDRSSAVFPKRIACAPLNHWLCFDEAVAAGRRQRCHRFQLESTCRADGFEVLAGAFSASEVDQHVEVAEVGDG